jgi:acyl-CoA synthetase (AMP-forming)/AMP-acid ligase II
VATIAILEALRRCAIEGGSYRFVVSLTGTVPWLLRYVELAYACALLGVIAVPLNARLSAPAIDRVLADTNPDGLVRYSSLPAPRVRLSWQRVLDEEPLEIGNDLHPNRQSGELVPAYVVLKSGQAFRSDELIAYCRRFLANYKIPRRVEFSENRAAEERLGQDPEENSPGTLLG